MVIVIMSSGIPVKPIIPRIKKAARKFGTMPIIDKAKFLNNTKNIANIPIITIPSVRICDLNKLCNKLLNNINTPVSLYSSSFKFNFDFKSLSIYFISASLLKSSKESFTLTVILASSVLTEM